MDFRRRAQDRRAGGRSDPEYQFGQVGWLTVDSQGRIFVLDAQAQHVQVYAPDGVYERTVGGKGSGPGELQGAMFLFMGRGDTLLVPDIQNQRVNRYAPDGSSLGSFRISLEQGLPLMFRATPSGTVAEQVRPLSLPGQPAPENPEDAIVLLAADGTVTDTLMKFASGGTLRFREAGPPEIHIYASEPVWELTDDLKLLFGVNDDYRIGLYAADAQLERVITKPFERQPVGERDREAIMKFLERAWSDAGVPAQMLTQLRERIHFGEFFPAFATVVAGPYGTVWVQHVQPASQLSEEEFAAFNPLEDTGGPDWDVFDDQGRFLGVVTLPRRFAPRLFRDDKIYGVWRDELDVQFVVQLRIVGDLAAAAT